MAGILQPRCMIRRIEAGSLEDRHLQAAGPQVPRHPIWRCMIAMDRSSPSYKGLRPASNRASAAARASSRKTDTRHEQRLRSALWRAGCRFRKNMRELPGTPDIVFTKAKLVIFCDGDFWHGRDWEQRKTRLQSGSNPGYWVKKIGRNMERDREITKLLETSGWKVLRFWESDILRDPQAVASQVIHMLSLRDHLHSRD